MSKEIEVSTPHASEMVVIIRPSFMKFCDHDACRSALFNHLLYWVSQKAKGQPEDKVRSGEVYWYGNIDHDLYEGLARSWGLSKVKKELKLLVGSGIIGQRHNSTKGFDRKFQYFFGVEQGKTLKELCQKQGVDLLKIGLQADVIHLLKTTNAIVISNQCNNAKTTNASVKNNQAIPKVSTKGSSKDINKERESAEHHQNQDGLDIPSVSPSSFSSSSEEKEQSPAIFTPEEETLLSWLKTENIAMSKKDDVVKEQLSELLPVISSIEMLHKEIEFVRGRISGNDPTVYLGNLVGNNLKAWLQTQQTEPEPEQASTPAPGDQIGMGKEEATDLLYNSILVHYPSFIYGCDEQNGRCCIGIAKSDTEWIDILKPDDWYYLPESEIELALAYAERMQVAV